MSSTDRVQQFAHELLRIAGLPITETDRALISMAMAEMRVIFMHGYHQLVCLGLGTNNTLANPYKGIHHDGKIAQVSGCAELFARYFARKAGDLLGLIVTVRQSVDGEIRVATPCGPCREELYKHNPAMLVIVPFENDYVKVPIWVLLPLMREPASVDSLTGVSDLIIQTLNEPEFDLSEPERGLIDLTFLKAEAKASNEEITVAYAIGQSGRRYSGEGDEEDSAPFYTIHLAEETEDRLQSIVIASQPTDGGLHYIGLPAGKDCERLFQFSPGVRVITPCETGCEEPIRAVPIEIHLPFAYAVRERPSGIAP
jgi:cytidine deaminase